MSISSLGKRFASLKKCWTSQTKRANNFLAKKNLFGSNRYRSTIETPSTSTKQGASPQEMTVQEKQEIMLLLAPVGEKLHTNYQLHNFPTVSKEDEATHVLLNTGLLARIETLESKNREL